MMVRLAIQQPLPDYMIPVSEGHWDFGNIKSTKVELPSMSPLVAKYGLANVDQHIKDLSHNICLDAAYNPYFTTPYYIKGMARLTERTPSIYHHFVPTVDELLDTTPSHDCEDTYI